MFFFALLALPVFSVSVGDEISPEFMIDSGAHKEIVALGIKGDRFRAQGRIPEALRVYEKSLTYFFLPPLPLIYKVANAHLLLRDYGLAMGVIESGLAARFRSDHSKDNATLTDVFSRIAHNDYFDPTLLITIVELNIRARYLRLVELRKFVTDPVKAKSVSPGTAEDVLWFRTELSTSSQKHQPPFVRFLDDLTLYVGRAIRDARYVLVREQLETIFGRLSLIQVFIDRVYPSRPPDATDTTPRDFATIRLFEKVIAVLLNPLNSSASSASGLGAKFFPEAYELFFIVQTYKKNDERISNALVGNYRSDIALYARAVGIQEALKKIEKLLSIKLKDIVPRLQEASKVLLELETEESRSLYSLIGVDRWVENDPIRGLYHAKQYEERARTHNPDVAFEYMKRFSDKENLTSIDWFKALPPVTGSAMSRY